MAVGVSTTTDGHPRQNLARKQHSGQVILLPLSVSPRKMELVGVGRIIEKASKRIEKVRPKSTSLR